MNIFQRWRRKGMRRRIAHVVEFGFRMAHMPPFVDRTPRNDLHRAEHRAYWRGYARGVRAFRKPINVQHELDKMKDIVDRFRQDPSKKEALADELRSIALSDYANSIDERHEEVYAAFEAAAGELGIRGEPDTEFHLAEIEAEKRRSAERQLRRELRAA